MEEKLEKPVYDLNNRSEKGLESFRIILERILKNLEKQIGA